MRRFELAATMVLEVGKPWREADADDDITYKVSGLWTLNDIIAFRRSYGTGFKAPSMREIGEPLSDFGVTSGTYACPFPASDPRSRTCKPGENQVNVFR